MSPDGKHVYVGSIIGSSLAVFSRNESTGELTQLPGDQGCFNGDGSQPECAPAVALGGSFALTGSPDGGNVYVAAFDSDAISVFSRESSTGALAQLEGTDGCLSKDGIGGKCHAVSTLDGSHQVALSPDGEFAYAAAKCSNAVSIFKVLGSDDGPGSGNGAQPGFDACTGTGSDPGSGSGSGPGTGPGGGSAPPPPPGSGALPRPLVTAPDVNARSLSIGSTRFDRGGNLRVGVRNLTRRPLTVRLQVRVRGRGRRTIGRWVVSRRIAAGARRTVVIRRAARRLQRSRHGKGIRRVRIELQARVDQGLVARRSTTARVPLVSIGMPRFDRSGALRVELGNLTRRTLTVRTLVRARARGSRRTVASWVVRRRIRSGAHTTIAIRRAARRLRRTRRSSIEVKVEVRGRVVAQRRATTSVPR